MKSNRFAAMNSLFVAVSVCMTVSAILPYCSMLKIEGGSLLALSISVLMLFGSMIASRASGVSWEEWLLRSAWLSVMIFAQLFVAPIFSVMQPSSPPLFAFDIAGLYLLIFGCIFFPLEGLGRLNIELDPTAFRLNLAYFLVNAALFPVYVAIAEIPGSAIAAQIGRVSVEELHPLAQFALVAALADFFHYWWHRSLHAVPFFWRFHKIHHSSESMSWLASSRTHLLESVVARSIIQIPFMIVGFNPVVVSVYGAIALFYVTLTHANTRLPMGRLERVFISPRAHHWHHSREPGHEHFNFGSILSVFDIAFGTYSAPKGQWPSAYGLEGDPCASTLAGQLIEPLTPSRGPV